MSLFDNDDPFGLPPTQGSNAPPEYTVSELSHKLKRVVEEEFSYVRVRGEISKVTVAKSGHLYTSLKDVDAVLDAICWKGTVARLGVRPEEGMEVICTGRLTTYPGRSNYQLIIETMELAGQGALLKMLEERRKKLAAEGLFEAARKKKIPFLPELIGIITSPTGAVIRDIMHRLDERFPRRVLLWPVMVQGQTASASVIAAIRGFNSLPADSPHRPDLLIVARGGGSLEDLMPFNDEALVRAVAASAIPVISAVGHETDTTLIDYAADLRAPTPTAAAEKAVPVRTELLAQVIDTERRMISGTQRLLQHHRTHLQGLGRGLGDPKRLLDASLQRLDHLSSRLDTGLQHWLQRRSATLNELAAKLSPQALLRPLEAGTQRLEHLSSRMDMGLKNWLQRRTAKLNEISAKLSPQNLGRQIRDMQRIVSGMGERLTQTERKILHERIVTLKNFGAMLESLSFKRVLDRGYAVIRDDKGEILTSVNALKPGQDIKIQVKDGETAATVKNK
jgi:exodeoxyribonuclease VII large subunit